VIALLQTGGNIGLGSVNIPGELFHIGDGNMLLEGGGEVAQNLNVTLVPLGKIQVYKQVQVYLQILYFKLVE
jgi:hypothetical protein